MNSVQWNFALLIYYLLVFWIRATALKIHKLLIFLKFKSKIDSCHRRLLLFGLASSERGSNFRMFHFIRLLLLIFCRRPVMLANMRIQMLVLLLLMLALVLQHNLQHLLSLSFGHTKSIFIGWHSRANKKL